MIRHLVLILACLIAVNVAAQTAADDDAELVRIDDLLGAGRAAAALVRVEALLASPYLEPRNVWRARQRLGAALVALGRPQEAVPILESVIAEVKQEASPCLNLARAFVALGQPGRAMAAFQNALELDPGRPEWRLEYAAALLDLGVRREAARQIAEARQLCGDCPPALRAEANLHLAAGDPARAVAPLRALRQRGAGPVVRGLLVAALWNIGESDGAAAELDTVPGEELSPEEMMVLVQLERQHGRAARALRWLADEPSDRPVGWEPPARFWALASEACLVAGEVTAALEAIDRALARRPDEAIYHHNRAAVLVRLGRQVDARRAMDQALRLDPNLGGQR